MNILVLGLGSYIVKDTTGYDKNCFDRQFLYAAAIKQLCEVVPENTDIAIVENTCVNAKDLFLPLQKILAHKKITAFLQANNNQLGAKNKGAGEYGMCQYALETRPDLFEKADWVIYYTHRHTMPFPLVFEHIQNFGGYDAIVSTASYLFPDGSASVPVDGLYDDVIFAMKKDKFLNYIKSMNPEELIKKRIGSEQNLYQFIHQNKLNFKQVSHFGICRYNYASFQMEVI